MDILDRFRGGLPPGSQRGLLVANPAIEQPASLQLLFGATPALDSRTLAAMLRAYHLDLMGASVELFNVADVPGSETVVSSDGPPAKTLGLIGWGLHVIRLVAFDAPMPARAINACMQAALLPQEIKDDARKHAAHVLLYYAGFEDDPLEQWVALAAVAGVLAELGAIVTLNEEARAAVLSTELLPDQDGEDMLTVLRTLPLPYLYCGFVKMLLTDIPGVWMRTFAAHRLKLPELAVHAENHDEGQTTFHLFNSLLRYLKETGLTFENGELIRIDNDRVLKVREPQQPEWWLDSPGTLWVLEWAGE